MQTFSPLDEENTEFTSRLFQTRLPENAAASAEQLELINQSAATFNRQVFKEDAEICEAVQLGIRDAVGVRGILSDEEVRVCHFHAECLRRLSDTSALPAESM